MNTKVLDINLDVLTMSLAIDKLMSFLQKDKNHLIFTVNAEIAMNAYNDRCFFNILQDGDMVLPDGIGIVLASKFNKIKIKERVSGIDLVLNLFEHIKGNNYKVYLLGGKSGVSDAAKHFIINKYGIEVLGSDTGYFDKIKEQKIIDNIVKTKPDILLVGLGSPKQEEWIYRYKDDLPVKLSITVGGSLDVFAKVVKRAPLYLQKLGLEWLYRLIKQPARWRRALNLPLFAIIVILKNFKQR